MVVLIALTGAAIVGLLLWKAMNLTRDEASTRPSVRPRVSAPDDDPDFLRQLDERRRRDGKDGPKS